MWFVNYFIKKVFKEIEDEIKESFKNYPEL